MDIVMGIIFGYLAWTMFKAMVRANEELKKQQANLNREPGLEEIDEKTLAITFDQPTPDDVIIVHDHFGNYVCQGWTLKEIQNNFMARFPEMRAVIVDPAAKLFYRQREMLESMEIYNLKDTDISVSDPTYKKPE